MWKQNLNLRKKCYEMQSLGWDSLAYKHEKVAKILFSGMFNYLHENWKDLLLKYIGTGLIQSLWEQDKVITLA